ncbi:MAG TPA: hypothetical protein VFK05_31420 [Polyangiaceae bacterium]|nr:hypothetical protein [Polyangiaceae bacterium]
MNRVRASVFLAGIVFSVLGCVVRTYPEHAHHRHQREHHGHYRGHPDVIVVHHD